jgi:hypothetical protein
MKYTYSQPKQNYKGLWEITITEGERLIEITTRTTKKAIIQYVKDHKLKN